MKVHIGPAHLTSAQKTKEMCCWGSVLIEDPTLYSIDFIYNKKQAKLSFAWSTVSDQLILDIIYNKK